MRTISFLITCLIFAQCSTDFERGDLPDNYIPLEFRMISAKLESVLEEDQKHRQQMDAVSAQYGWNSDEMDSLWRITSVQDSINLVFIEEILSKHGWLGSDKIGVNGNATLFLVIQHANHTIQERYLPAMREAVEKGDAYAADLALLEDRAALGRGDKQIYGSQIGMDPNTGAYFILPLADPDNVNERRKDVGLSTIEFYVGMYGIAWDVEAYKIWLAEREARRNK